MTTHAKEAAAAAKSRPRKPRSNPTIAQVKAAFWLVYEQCIAAAVAAADAKTFERNRGVSPASIYDLQNHITIAKRESLRLCNLLHDQIAELRKLKSRHSACSLLRDEAKTALANHLAKFTSNNEVTRIPDEDQFLADTYDNRATDAANAATGIAAKIHTQTALIDETERNYKQFIDEISNVSAKIESARNEIAKDRKQLAYLRGLATKRANAEPMRTIRKKHPYFFNEFKISVKPS